MVPYLWIWSLGNKGCGKQQALKSLLLCLNLSGAALSRERGVLSEGPPGLVVRFERYINCEVDEVNSQRHVRQTQERLTGTCSDVSMAGRTGARWFSCSQHQESSRRAAHRREPRRRGRQGHKSKRRPWRICLQHIIMRTGEHVVVARPVGYLSRRFR